MLLTNNINTSVVVGWFFTLMKNLWYPFIYIYIYIERERERERERELSQFWLQFQESEGQFWFCKSDLVLVCMGINQGHTPSS